MQDKRSRRLVLGLHEVKRGLLARKIRLLLVGTDIEECGTLDDKVAEILTIARKAQVPVVFPMTRLVIALVLSNLLRLFDHCDQLCLVTLCVQAQVGPRAKQECACELCRCVLVRRCERSFCGDHSLCEHKRPLVKHTCIKFCWFIVALWRCVLAINLHSVRSSTRVFETPALQVQGGIDPLSTAGAQRQQERETIQQRE